MLRRLMVVLSFSALVCVCAAAQTTAIRAGRVIDPDTGTTSTNQIILNASARPRISSLPLTIL